MLQTELRPSYDEIQKFICDYKYIPVSDYMYADICTPLEILKKLKNISSHCFIFESMEDNENRGRYTFLGCNPILELVCRNGTIKIKDKNGAEIVYGSVHGNPENYIKKIMQDFKSPRFDYLPPFTGGMVGYFSYDYIKYSEPGLKLDADDTDGFNDVDLMLFDKVIAYDNLKQKIIIIVNINVENYEDEYKKAVQSINEIKSLILNGNACIDEPLTLESEFESLFSKDEYIKKVMKAKEYIHEGDIFQVVLSNRFRADAKGSLLDTYRILRTSNPSPYMFYMSGTDIEIAGSSPETLVRLNGNSVSTYPLAGTRPRGNNCDDDKLEHELLDDPKERAEHNMLVDLGRNDLGKVCSFGSVKVSNYMSVVKFSHVMHISSKVCGIKRKGVTSADIMGAVLPAGTLSGAPKIRACEIINELEKNRRGVYGGAIGYLSMSGDMDACIAIRIAYKKNGSVFVRSGAGIVYDSRPENEYNECLNKARAVLDALRLADGGLYNDFNDR